MTSALADPQDFPAQCEQRRCSSPPVLGSTRRASGASIVSGRAQPGRRRSGRSHGSQWARLRGLTPSRRRTRRRSMQHWKVSLWRLERRLLPAHLPIVCLGVPPSSNYKRQQHAFRSLFSFSATNVEDVVTFGVCQYPHCSWDGEVAPLRAPLSSVARNECLATTARL